MSREPGYPSLTSLNPHASEFVPSAAALKSLPLGEKAVKPAAATSRASKAPRTTGAAAGGVASNPHRGIGRKSFPASTDLSLRREGLIVDESRTCITAAVNVPKGQRHRSRRHGAGDQVEVLQAAAAPAATPATPTFRTIRGRTRKGEDGRDLTVQGKGVPSDGLLGSAQAVPACGDGSTGGRRTRRQRGANAYRRAGWVW